MDRVVSSLERKLESMTEACLNFEKENKELKKIKLIDNAKLENAQKNVDISKKSLSDMILKYNDLKEEMAREIDTLKAKLKTAQEALN